MIHDCLHEICVVLNMQQALQQVALTLLRCKMYYSCRVKAA